MANTIRIGTFEVSSFKVGSSDCKIYLGSVKLYPTVEPTIKNYLRFIAKSSGTFTFTGNDIDYSLDSGATWTTLSNGNATPRITAGSSILWKANGLTPTSSIGIGTFSSAANFVAEGNVMSLLYGDNFENQTSLSGKDYALRNLFNGCTSLISIENLVLPATTLAKYCYGSMFYRCTSLTTAPELPATTLAENCYNNMFYGCTSLTTVPSDLLPATTLAKRCYYSMFYGCTGLTTPPQLPATALITGCYYSMFYNNSSLTTSPVLPALTLVQDCYRQMFYNCRKLNKIICLATNISASNCTNNWVSNVAASGTFYKASGMSSWTTGNSGIPTSWTLVDYSPYKLVAQYSDTTEYKVECNSSKSLTQTEVTSHTTPISAMTSAVVGYCVTEIGLNAFSGASSLTSLTLSDDITRFNNQSFFSLGSLSSFTFPSSLTNLGGSTFRFSGIRKFNNKIPSGVTYLSSGALADMYKLTGMTIPATITGSSTNLFLRDSGLTQVHFEGTTPPALGADAFKGCTALIKIYIPDCDCYDSYAAQSQFSGYTDLIYGEDETKCKRDTYAYRLKRISRGGSAYTLACDSTSAATVSSAQTRTGLTTSQITGATASQTPTSIIFGDCCKTINNGACSGWTQLTSITISDSTTTINSNAFRGCVRVSNLNIGSGVKTISGTQTFYQIGASASIKPDLDLSLNNGITISGSVFCSSSLKNVLIPKNAKLYGDTFQSSVISSISFGSGTTIVGGTNSSNGAFSLSEITSLNLNGVTSIGDYAFSKTNVLSTVNIPASVTSMGSRTFGSGSTIATANVNCTGSLGGYAFIDCKNLSQLTIGEKVTHIGTTAFEGCTSLGNVVIPDNVTSIGDYAFRECTSLSSITLSESITKISSFLFAGDIKLKNVVIPSGVTEIDRGAFSGCTNMGSLTVLPTTPPNLEYSYDTFATMGGKIYVKAESLNAYRTASGWSLQASRIQAIPT